MTVPSDSAVSTTVVLAVWDAYVGGRLSEAIASLREQDVPARIVVVDNASEVELPHLAETEVIRSPRRLSLGSARNLGVTQVGTPYVVMWDADDLMLPGTLAFLESAIGEDRRLAAFATAIMEEPSGTRHRWPRRWIGTMVGVPPIFALLHSVWSVYPTTGSTIMRTELVNAAGGYSDDESGEDWCLGVSLAFRGRIGWSERPGRIYRLDDQSVLARHMTVPHLLLHARKVRERIRGDAGMPAWARSILPLIQLGQYTAVAAHLAISALRRLRRRARAAQTREEPGR
jgi:glycosyltransferase involved in cell wall biosynthesis